MNYYQSGDLAKFPEIGKDAPELAKAFFDWYGKVFAAGELTVREKNLIAIAVAHALRCPYSIDAYTGTALGCGCSKGELTEAVQVAAAITGGATLMHGVQMRKKADGASQ